MSHVDDGQLEMWLDRSRSAMPPQEIERIWGHLESCTACAARLAEATRVRQRAESILGGMQLDERRMPDFGRVVARAAGGSRPEPRVGHPRHWVTLAWAASVIAAVGLGWLTRDLFSPGQLALDDSAVYSGAASRSAEAARSSAAERASPVEPAGAETSAVAGVQATPANGPRPERLAVEGEPPVRTQMNQAADRPTASASRANAGADADTRQAAEPAAPPAAPAALAAPMTSNQADRADDRVGGVARGRVTNPEGQPLAGALIRLGSRASTLTTAEGTFTLPIPADARGADGYPTLTAVALGYEPRTLALAGGPDTVVADIELTPSPISLESIVAVGYGWSEATPGATPARPPTGEMRIAAADVAPAPDNLNTPRQVTQMQVRAAAAPAPGVPVTREDASRRLGVPIVTVPGLPVLSIELADDGGNAVVYVRQRMDNGSTLLLAQATGGPPRLPSIAGTPSVARAARGRLLIAAAAAADADALEALLATAE